MLARLRLSAEAARSAAKLAGKSFSTIATAATQHSTLPAHLSTLIERRKSSVAIASAAPTPRYTLKQEGQDPNDIVEKGDTRLIATARLEGYESIISMLEKHAGKIDLKAWNDTGENVLHAILGNEKITAYQAHILIQGVLNEAAKNPNTLKDLLSQRDDDGNPPLFKALDSGHHNAAIELMRFDPLAIYFYNPNYGRNIFHCIAKMTDPEARKSVLEAIRDSTNIRTIQNVLLTPNTSGQTPTLTPEEMSLVLSGASLDVDPRAEVAKLLAARRDATEPLDPRILAYAALIGDEVGRQQALADILERTTPQQAGMAFATTPTIDNFGRGSLLKALLCNGEFACHPELRLGREETAKILGCPVSALSAAFLTPARAEILSL